jgi:hypothetical protein
VTISLNLQISSGVQSDLHNTKVPTHPAVPETSVAFAARRRGVAANMWAATRGHRWIVDARRRTKAECSVLKYIGEKPAWLDKRRGVCMVVYMREVDCLRLLGCFFVDGLMLPRPLFSSYSSTMMCRCWDGGRPVKLYASWNLVSWRMILDGKTEPVMPRR